MSHQNRAFCRAGIPWDPGFPEDRLPDGYTVRVQAGASLSGDLLDTFSGEMRGSGMLLIQQPDELVLLDPVGGGIQRQESPLGWAFAEQLHGGVIGYQLAQISALRAFVPVCTVVVEQCDLSFLDELDKTVARAKVTVVSQDGNPAVWLALVPLRGYDKELKRVAACIESAGFEPCASDTDYYRLLGLDWDRYRSKPGIALGWDTPIHDSATLIAATFLGVARRNEEGILSDRDTEFLHDFRVSLRRVRSLLSLFDQVFDAEASGPVKKTLAHVMRQTNRLRDLDVYLMQRSAFFQLVPESMYPGLEILFDLYERERKDAFERVCTFLKGDEYRAQMDGLQQIFDKPDAMPPGYRAGELSGPYACQTVLKRYRRVAKIARTIAADTPDETVHALRIQCKKLRYLMEFFAPLFPAESLKQLVRRLKGLQDLLGQFNDCSVQRESLDRFVKEHPLRGRRGMVLAESVGALGATLYQMQLRARSEIDCALRDFANQQTNHDFKQLFSNGGAR